MNKSSKVLEKFSVARPQIDRYTHTCTHSRDVSAVMFAKRNISKSEHAYKMILHCAWRWMCVEKSFRENLALKYGRCTTISREMDTFTSRTYRNNNASICTHTHIYIHTEMYVYKFVVVKLSQEKCKNKLA